MHTHRSELEPDHSIEENDQNHQNHGEIQAGEKLKSLCKEAGTRMTFSIRMLIEHPTPPAELRELASHLQTIVSDDATATEKSNAANYASAICINELSADEAHATRLVLNKISLHLNPTFSAYRKAIRSIEAEHTSVSIDKEDLLVSIRISDTENKREKLIQFLEAVAPLWLDIIELSLGASDDEVKLWAPEDHETLINAIRCYYVLVSHAPTKFPRVRRPEFSLEFRSSHSALASYVNVGLPLWRRSHVYLGSLPEYLSSFTKSPQLANRQQAAIWRHLVDHFNGHTPDPMIEPKFTAILASPPKLMADVHSEFESQTDICNPISHQHKKSIAAPSLQVVHGPIPRAHNREDAELLKQYEPLANTMMPVAVMPDLSVVEQIVKTLKSEYPWAQSATDEVARLLQLRSHFGCTELMLPPLLLAGPPGSGKSRFARRLAELLSLPFQNISLAGSHDVKLIMGTSRGWGSTTPTPLLSRILQSRSASVLVLLDEIDKCSLYGSSSKPLANALLSLLEPETSANFRDSCLQTKCDLSRLIYIATANSLSIDKALLSRFTVLHVPEPRVEDRASLANSMLGDIAKEMGFPREAMPEVPREVINLIDGNARTVRAVLKRFLHQWAQENLSRERLH